MSTNSSFSTDIPFIPKPLSVDSYSCILTSPGLFLFITFNVIHTTVILPLCIFILYVGFQQLRQKTSKSTSHCDSFTYHMVLIEMIGILGCIISFCGNRMGNLKTLTAGMNIFAFTWYGQLYFHILTSVERYLAVVHPITYLSLRNERGIRIRNIIIGCVWLFCIAGVGLASREKYIYLDLFLLILSTIMVSFCSLSVLRVLNRSGPGQQAEDRERVDQSKQRAFYTIVVILGILMLRLIFGLVWVGLDLSGNSSQCMLLVSATWVDLPSSLVLPLLFLQRTGTGTQSRTAAPANGEEPVKVLALDKQRKMSANPFFSNDSLLTLHVVTDHFYSCFIGSPGELVFSSFSLLYVLLLLPLCIFILYFGFHQLQQRSPTSSTISHCDSFTYHMVSMEVIGMLGCVVSLCGNCLDNHSVFVIGINMFSFTWYGQVYFHILTCVERYLAVVHPIAYLSLRKKRGIRTRNIIIGCVWLLCFMGVFVDSTGNYIYLDSCLLISSTLIISFCSLSVLCVLIRPAPGERGEGRETVDQSKQRAFYTIVLILGILIVRLSFGLVWAGLVLSENRTQCLVMVCGVWINLPSSLVLPLLFLQRAGKLQCCKNTNITFSMNRVLQNKGN